MPKFQFNPKYNTKKGILFPHIGTVVLDELTDEQARRLFLISPRLFLVPPFPDLAAAKAPAVAAAEKTAKKQAESPENPA